MHLDHQPSVSESRTLEAPLVAEHLCHLNNHSTSKCWVSTTHRCSTPSPLKISTPLTAHQSLAIPSPPLRRIHPSPSRRRSSLMASPMLMATLSPSQEPVPLTASSPTTKPQIPTTTHQKLISTELSSSIRRHRWQWRNHHRCKDHQHHQHQRCTGSG